MVHFAHCAVAPFIPLPTIDMIRVLPQGGRATYGTNARILVTEPRIVCDPQSCVESRIRPTNSQRSFKIYKKQTEERVLPQQPLVTNNCGAGTTYIWETRERERERERERAKNDD